MTLPRKSKVDHEHYNGPSAAEFEDVLGRAFGDIWARNPEVMGKQNSFAHDSRVSDEKLHILNWEELVGPAGFEPAAKGL